MPKGNVGAGILNIITESLYDKPIVVFREYVQNSVDSFSKIEEKVDSEELVSPIWFNDNNLYFLDNGNGIRKDDFRHEMRGIANSKKTRINNIGYKGIGRLSGMPYCKKLIFININSFKNDDFQRYFIDGEKYNNLKNQDNFSELDFESAMDQIGTYTEKLSGDDLIEIRSILSDYKKIFANQDTGFLVILEDVSIILNQILDSKNEDNLIKELGWLLPVKFQDELLQSNEKQLFKDLMEPLENTTVIPAKAYNITFNNNKIERPIKADMLRDYTCVINLKYAIGFHSFYHDRITVTKGNEFSGIKLYIDNILLCDENELIPSLQRYGLTTHSINELVQTVKGMGVIIYITDKINISANARRTFIEVTDSDSYDFLEILAEFVNNIYDARYALSKYSSAKNSIEKSSGKIKELRESANAALQKLARDEIIIDSEDKTATAFNDLNPVDQKKAIKKRISAFMNQKIKEYLLQLPSIDYDNAIRDFTNWFCSNK